MTNYIWPHSFTWMLWHSPVFISARVLMNYYGLARFQGTEFYVNLLKTLQNRYKFTLEAYYDITQPYPYTSRRSAKLALYSAHICLLCLGDLARYREQQHHGSNYAQAKRSVHDDCAFTYTYMRVMFCTPTYNIHVHVIAPCCSWYEKAQMVMPKNGRPYNQLAILAMYSVRTTAGFPILMVYSVRDATQN